MQQCDDMWEVAWPDYTPLLANRFCWTMGTYIHLSVLPHNLYFELILHPHPSPPARALLLLFMHSNPQACFCSHVEPVGLQEIELFT